MLNAHPVVLCSEHTQNLNTFTIIVPRGKPLATPLWAFTVAFFLLPPSVLDTEAVILSK